MSGLSPVEVLPRFDFVRPANLAEAITILEDRGEIAHPLAGGTDLAVALRQGKSRDGVIVDLKKVAELSPSIEQREGVFVIGANTPMAEVEHDQMIRDRIPGLVEAAEVVGSVQIRNRATLAGNLCNASPAADTPPMLVALGTSIVVVGPGGERHITVGELLTGYRETALTRGEVVRALEIPLPAPGTGTAFLKLGVRRAMEISIVCVGARLELAGDGTIAGVGIGLGSVAPTTVRPAESEDVLMGEKPTPALFAEAGSRALAACSPIDDLRASAAYRRAMVPVMLERALKLAYERAGHRT